MKQILTSIYVVGLILVGLWPVSALCNSVSDYENRLAENLSLQYDYGVKNADKVDYLLAELMKPLLDKPDSVSRADFYWDWATNVTSTIDRLHEDYGMFSTNGSDPYNDAIAELEEYIDPSLVCGSKAEMNAGSYVLAAIENYRMMKAVQELADILPDVNIRHEYELYSEFMSAFEDWRAVYDERNGIYGDLTLVRNCNASKRFKDRRTSTEEMIGVIKSDSEILPARKITSADSAFSKLAAACEQGKDLVPQIKFSFSRWIDYRNKIAADMPQKVAQSYRHQTERLIDFYMSDQFLYEDEL